MTQGMYIPSHFKPESLSRLEVATLAHRKGRSDENSECRGAIALSAREVWEVQSRHYDETRHYDVTAVTATRRTRTDGNSAPSRAAGPPPRAVGPPPRPLPAGG